MERGPGGVEQSKQIWLTTDDLSQMVLVFQSQWRRDSTPEELRALVEDEVHEKVLYREALVLGIDQGRVGKAMEVSNQSRPAAESVQPGQLVEAQHLTRFGHLACSKAIVH